MKATAAVVSILLLGTGCTGTAAEVAPAVDPPEAPTSSAAAAVEPPTPVTPRVVRTPFDKQTHSTTDPASIWVIVDRRHAIEPSDFRPDLAIVRGYQVASAAAPSLERLLDAADAAGLGLKIESALRSYAYQEGVHAALVASTGQAHADRYSAAAGHSEHQTGLAVDLITPADPSCDFEPCFARTPAGRWIAREAHRFGYIVRYTIADQVVTGYAPEPWHLRYVGRELARELHRRHVATLEEFFGVPG